MIYWMSSKMTKNRAAKNGKAYLQWKDNQTESLTVDGMMNLKGCLYLMVNYQNGEARP